MKSSKYKKHTLTFLFSSKQVKSLCERHPQKESSILSTRAEELGPGEVHTDFILKASLSFSHLTTWFSLPQLPLFRRHESNKTPHFSRWSLGHFPGSSVSRVSPRSTGRTHVINSCLLFSCSPGFYDRGTVLSQEPRGGGKITTPQEREFSIPAGPKCNFTGSWG